MLKIRRYEDQVVRLSGQKMIIFYIERDYIMFKWGNHRYKLRLGESVDLGPMRVILIAVKNGKNALIGFEGPRTIDVWREEVYRRMNIDV
jgi:hypothetical protein